MSNISQKLEEFAFKSSIQGKGPLSVMLVLTRKLKEVDPPFSAQDFLTPQGGQVAGLGRTAVQKILADHGIKRVLAEEGGRTSRGSIKKMQAYVDLLNKLAQKGELDLDETEHFWVERVKRFFASQPLKIKADSSKSLRCIVAELIQEAFSRQKECPGTMVAGAVLQHLVGAKLELALPNEKIRHHGFSVADKPSNRRGDYLIGDTALHITTAPSEGLMRKCATNLQNNLRPLIITTKEGSGGASALAKNLDIADRIEILEVEQFVATNVLEWSKFSLAQRPVTVRELIDCYNRIISECETDPSLMISVN